MYLKVDASQLEWRTAVELSKDPVGLEEIKNKADAHSLNQVAFQLPSRLIAKIYLFRTIFRGSGYAFANDPQFMHVSTVPKYWDKVNELFYTKYYGLDNWHKKMADEVLNGRLIVTPFGREFNIQMGRDRRGELKLPWTVFSNYPVQGTGADIMTIFRLSLKRRLAARGIPVKWVATVHDDVKLDMEPQYIQEVTDICYACFDDLPKNILKIFGYDWQTPLACEASQGMNLFDMEEVHRSA